MANDVKNMSTNYPKNDNRIRCPWRESKSLDRHYHDTEWGVPMHDDRDLLELLTLEGAQATNAFLRILTRRK